MPRKPTTSTTKGWPVVRTVQACVIIPCLRTDYLRRLDVLANQLSGSRSDAVYYLLDSASRHGAKIP
jgi:hypothetical protein